MLTVKKYLLLSSLLLMTITSNKAEKVFEIEPEDQIIPLHSTATITMTCKANIPNPKYTWMKDLVVLEDDTNSKYQFIGGTLQIKNPDKTDVGGYQCIVGSSSDNVVASNFGNLTLGYIDDFEDMSSSYKGYEKEFLVMKCNGLGDYEPKNQVAFGWETQPEWNSYTTLSENSRIYVSYQTGTLYFANLQLIDSNSYVCKVRSKGWSLNGSNVEKHSSVIEVDVEPANSNYVPISFLLSPDPITYAVLGKKAFLECFAGGYPTPEIVWSRVGGEMPKGSRKYGSGLMMIPDITEEDEGAYRCTAKNENSSKFKDTEIRLEYAPQWTKEIYSKDVDVTTSAIITCAAKGEPPAELAWIKNGKLLEERTSKINIVGSGQESTLYIHDFNENDSGMFQCVAKNKHGTILSTAELRAFDSIPEFVETMPDIMKVSIGGTFSLPCKVSASPPASVTWYQNEQKIIIFDDEIDVNRVTVDNVGLKISRIVQEDAGTYTCSASNHRGTINSTGLLQVFGKTEIVSNSGQPDKVISGDWATLWCKAVYDKDLILTWEWTFNDQKISGFGDSGFDVAGSTLEILASGDKSGIYKCIAKTDVGNDSKEFHLQIKDVPSPPSSLQTSSSPDVGVLLQWSPPNINLSPLISQDVEARLVYKNGSFGGWNTAETSPQLLVNETGCLIKGLLPYNNYQFRVRATNMVGRGAYSEPSLPVLTQPGEPQQTVKILRGGGGNPNQLVVKWELLDPIFYGAQSVIYVVKVWKKNTSESESIEEIQSNPNEGSIVIDIERQVYKPYNVRISVHNLAGFKGEWSDISTVYSGELIPDEAVNSSSIYERKAYSASITWPSIENKNGFTLGYKVVLVDMVIDSAMKAPETWLNYTTKNEVPNIVVDGLEAQGAYAHKIAAFNSAGVGPFSEWLDYIQTRKLPPSQAPGEIKLTITSQNLVGEWAEVQTAVNEEILEGYKVKYWETGFYDEARVEIVKDPYISLDLPKKSEYNLEIRAYSKGGDGPTSGEIPFSTNSGSYLGLGGSAMKSANIDTVLLIASLLLGYNLIR